MRTRYLAALAVGAAIIGVLVVTAPWSRGAEATNRPATAAELEPPAGELDRLTSDLGLVLTSPDAADVDVRIAASAADAISGTQYASQVGDARSVQYLVHVEAADNAGVSVTPDELVWVVHYTGLNVASGAPMTESGRPAEPAVITQGFVLISADTGAFLLAHWTD
jgi:hypothetical protein